MRLRIYPLLGGWLDNDICTFDPGAASSPLRAPVLFWVISVDGLTVLFDTGASDPSLAERRGHRNYRRNGNEDPLSQMHSIGLEPGDIDAVVLSHLHWDHAGNWQMFRGARLYVQTAELSYAASPEAAHRKYFDTVAEPPAAIPDPGTGAVNGSSLVLGHPRLELMLLPGHTPGSQGLLILTEAARILLAGDTVPLLGNLAGCPRANGIATDRAAAQATIEKIPLLATDVLPSHDPMLAAYCGSDITEHLGELRETWLPPAPPRCVVHQGKR